jgi:ubiquinone/menaquinone biosynthesis C-methylase UbiE
MKQEIDLLKFYPQSKRPVEERGKLIKECDRAIARKFDKEYFDGDRLTGYGGYNYHPRFWTDTVKYIVEFYGLTNESKILDVGCAKGFMLYDFYKLNSNFDLHGVDISKYAIDNSVSEIKNKLLVANATKLPYEDNFFDLVISINTIHNLEKVECATALKEISRVSKKNAFITVDAYRNDEEKKRMDDWNLTAKTIMPVDDWIIFFEQNNYNGDFFWFIP